MRIKNFINIRELDENLMFFRAAQDTKVPHGGWARAIKDALGMTNVQLARRMNGKAPQSVDELLKSEAARSIKLSSLDDLALALNCRVVYALVPNRPIDATRQERALALAEEKLKGVFHTMALEGQPVSARKRSDILADYAGQLLHTRPRKLWD